MRSSGYGVKAASSIPARHSYTAKAFNDRLAAKTNKATAGLADARTTSNSPNKKFLHRKTFSGVLPETFNGILKERSVGERSKSPIS